jgi:hypothetical protein
MKDDSNVDTWKQDEDLRMILTLDTWRQNADVG